MKDYISKLWSSAVGWGLKGIKWSAIVIGCYLASYVILNSDSYGWIPHTKTIDVSMASDWMVGEERTCIGFQDSSPQIVSLACPVGDYTEKAHRFEVKFWGRISRPELLKPDASEENHFEWKCVRGGEGFTCWALN